MIKIATRRSFPTAFVTSTPEIAPQVFIKSIHVLFTACLTQKSAQNKSFGGRDARVESAPRRQIVLKQQQRQIKLGLDDSGLPRYRTRMKRPIIEVVFQLKLITTALPIFLTSCLLH